MAVRGYFVVIVAVFCASVLGYDPLVDDEVYRVEARCYLKCQTNDDPVCAIRDGYCYTFKNSCYLKSYNCQHLPEYELKSKGKCPDDCGCEDKPVPPPSCDTECSKDCRPVCGFRDADDTKTYKTFDNYCKFVKFNCVARPGFQYLSNSACPGDKEECCDE